MPADDPFVFDLADDPDGVEPLPEPSTRPAGLSVRDVLGAKLAERRKRQPVTLEVEGYDNVRVRYSATLPNERRTRMEKAARAKAKGGQTDGMAFNFAVLASQCEAIIVDGVELTDDGRRLRFGDAALQQMLGASSAVDAVRRLYGGNELDGDYVIAAHALRVLQAAGMDTRSDDLVEGDTEADPT